jgi:transcriptional regulator with XRE-family HTH domain
MIHSRMDEADRAKEALGDWIRCRRTELGLKRSEVAAKMGVTNLSKCASRIACWERGEEYPVGDRIDALRCALVLPLVEADAMTLLLDAARAASLAARAEVEELRKCDLWVTIAERHLFATNLDRLLERVDTLEALPAWRDIQLVGAESVMAYLGGRVLTLGALVGMWSRGELSTRCPGCGGVLRVVRVAGSPLSGTHRITGICARERRVFAAQDRRWGRLAHDAIRSGASSPAHGWTPWSLAQLIAHTDGRVRDIIVFGGRGGMVGSYRHEPASLVDRGGNTVAEFDFARSPSESSKRTPEMRARRRPAWGNARRQGRLVIGSISPLRAGLWLGERMEIAVGNGRPWMAHPAWLEDSRGCAVARFDGVLPPAVLVWLANEGRQWLTDSQDRGDV